MIEYIRQRLLKLSGKSHEEKDRVLREIYRDMAERGYSREKTFDMINEAILTNIKELVSKLRGGK